MLNYVKRVVPTHLKRALQQSLKDLTGESALWQRIRKLEQRSRERTQRLEQQIQRRTRRSEQQQIQRRTLRLEQRTRESEQRDRKLEQCTRKLEQRIQELEGLADELQASVFELQPEIVPRSDDTERAVTDMLVKHNVSPTVNLNISKNDLMYQFLVRYAGGTKRAYVEYIRSGLQMMQVIETIAHHKFGDIKNIETFLEFASGYGRMTRFLEQALGADRVCVSDIKRRAVEFQQQQFGVHGFVSSETPEDLMVGQRFDCISVVSLFTHLPEATFGRWIQRLYDLLSPNGILIFTARESGDLPTTREDGELQQEQESGITFLYVNEEKTLHSAEQALDPDSYGTTYVSEAFVRKVIEGLSLENKRYVRFEKAINGLQDIYVLSKNSGDVLPGLKLPVLQPR